MSDSVPFSDPFNFDPGNIDFFNSLPIFVQETIIQSGCEIKNESQLKEMADNLMGKK